ncbi:hypothetical protein GCM10027168_23250 [Streptomyces capparidis]|jgi:pilus assembly protein Flp/PilA
MVDLVTRTAARSRLAVKEWTQDRAEAIRSEDRDRGQTAIEYLGIAVIIVAIILALNGTSIGQTIQDGIMTKISEMLG